MSHIKIFESEKELGIADLITSTSSVVFDLECSDQTDKIDSSLLELTISKYNIEDPDLFHNYSILVSTVWNANDDIFDREEVWYARHTPKNKPTNIEHDESRIIGAMLDVWPVTLDLDLIPENTEVANLPEEYHLLVSSVIYRSWKEQQHSDEVEELIASIKSNEKFVSMECMFKGFDYGVMSSDGTKNIIARNESTAFLSQHLRAYGGSGYYQGYKIGRLLRNISFIAKGYVSTPANKRSIIFDPSTSFSFASAKKIDKNVIFEESGVSHSTKQPLNSDTNNNLEKKTMSDDILKQQIADLKDAVAKAQAENKELHDKLSKANITALEEKVQTQVASITELSSEKETLQTQLTEANTKVSDLEAELEATKSKLDEAAQAMKDMEAEQKKKDRKDKMVKAGLSEEDAEDKVNTLASLNDEQFNSMVKSITELKQAAQANSSDSTQDDNDDDSSTTASDLTEGDDDASGQHSIASDLTDDDEDTAEAGLQEWASSVLNVSQDK